MNNPFPDPRAYARPYASYHQQSAQPSGPQSHGANQQSHGPSQQTSGAPQLNIPAAHTSPPFPSGNLAASSFSSDTYPTRPSLHSSLISLAQQSSRAESYGYSQAGGTFYDGQSATAPPSSHPSRLHQQQFRQASDNSLSRPIYTSAPAHGRLPDLLPAPPQGQGNGNSSYPMVSSIPQPEAVVAPPTHVVGSQGRRGILPSAAGRPTAVAGTNTNGQKAAPTPPKDASGKYPCQYCIKTYLHAKHLKRHLLRREYSTFRDSCLHPNGCLDTGVRPYTCGLCEDTFSRSDILKRHFQKCSVRRGNPTGENHLSHSRANKKSKQERAARMQNNAPAKVSPTQQMEAFTPTSLEGSFDNLALNLGQPSYVESARQASRPNSIKKGKRSTGSHSNRASFGMANTSGYDAASYGYVSGHATPDSATTSGAATPYNYHHYDSRSAQISPNGVFSSINGRDMTYGGANRAPTTSNYIHGSLPHIAGQRGGPEIDWHSFQFNSNDDYGNSQYQSGTNTPLHPAKSEDSLTNLDYTFLSKQ